MARGPADAAAPTVLQRAPATQRFEFHTVCENGLNYFPLLSIVPVRENKKLTFLMVFVFSARLETLPGG